MRRRINTGPTEPRVVFHTEDANAQRKHTMYIYTLLRTRFDVMNECCRALGPSDLFTVTTDVLAVVQLPLLPNLPSAPEH